MTFLPYSEMWAEPDEDGCSAIRVAFDPEEQAAGSPARGTAPFIAYVKGQHGCAPVQMRFLAVIKGQVVFEALPALEVPSKGRVQSADWQLIWSPLLATT